MGKTGRRDSATRCRRIHLLCKESLWRRGGLLRQPRLGRMKRPDLKLFFNQPRSRSKTRRSSTPRLVAASLAGSAASRWNALHYEMWRGLSPRFRRQPRGAGSPSRSIRLAGSHFMSAPRARHRGEPAPARRGAREQRNGHRYANSMSPATSRPADQWAARHRSNRQTRTASSRTTGADEPRVTVDIFPARLLNALLPQRHPRLCGDRHHTTRPLSVHPPSSSSRRGRRAPAPGDPTQVHGRPAPEATNAQPAIRRFRG